MLTLGTWGFNARAADQNTGAPQCQTTQDEGGQATLVCDNLNNDQSLSMLQDQTARRRCYRECIFRIGPFCASYRVRCFGRDWGDDWDHGGHHGRH
ncbi:MAG: hypothetical protein ACXWR1_17430 [Bdellovibrionota bacterium]